MAIDEDKIRLLLELIGFNEVDEAIASLSHMRDTATEAQRAIEGDTYALQEVGATYELATTGVNTYDAAMDRMVADAIQATQAQKALAVALGQAETAAERTTVAVAGAGRGAANYGQNLQALGFAVNDFFSVSGDLSQRLVSISNNLPMIAAGFGGVGLALGALVPISAQVIKHWDELNAMMTGNTFKVPEAADHLIRLTDQLKAVTKQVEDLKEKQSLTNWELQQYNRLSADQVVLEEQKNRALEQRKSLDMLAGLRPEIESQRAAGFRKAVGEAGGGEGVASALRQALYNIGVASGQDFTLAGIAKQADDLMVEASKGSKDAIDTIRRAMRQGLPENQQKIADEIQANTPEAAESRKKGEEAQKEREKKDREALADTVDMLNQMGKANEEAMNQAEKEATEVAAAIASSREDLAAQRQKMEDWQRKQANDFDRSAEQFQKRREREVNPQRMIENQTAAQIQAATGADEATSHNLAKRALELQSQGIGLQQGVQFAMAELMAAANGNAQQLAALRQQLAAMIADIRRLKNQAFNEPFWMPAMQAGWGN